MASDIFGRPQRRHPQPTVRRPTRRRPTSRRPTAAREPTTPQPTARRPSGCVAEIVGADRYDGIRGTPVRTSTGPFGGKGTDRHRQFLPVMRRPILRRPAVRQPSMWLAGGRSQQVTSAVRIDHVGGSTQASAAPVRTAATVAVARQVHQRRRSAIAVYTAKKTTAAGTPVRMPSTSARPAASPWSHTTTSTSGPDVRGSAARRPPIRSPRGVVGPGPPGGRVSG